MTLFVKDLRQRDITAPKTERLGGDVLNFVEQPLSPFEEAFLVAVGASYRCLQENINARAHG